MVGTLIPSSVTFVLGQRLSHCLPSNVFSHMRVDDGCSSVVAALKGKSTWVIVRKRRNSSR